MPSSAASDAVRLMWAPSREYRRQLAEDQSGSWLRALQMPGLLAVMLGLLNSAAATGHISATLVVSESVAWSFIPFLQFLTGAALIASAKTRRVSFARAVELLFAAHAPWSLWLVAATIYQTIDANPYIVIGSGVVPLAITAYMLGAFGREVLGLSGRETRIRVFAHQAATVMLIVIYIELATRLSVRIIGAVGA